MISKLLKNYLIAMVSVVVVLSCSLMISDRCDAKVFYCDSHDKPKKLEGEFIAVYNMQKDQTVYYDSEELEKLPMDLHEPIEPKQPNWYKQMGQFKNVLTEQNNNLLPDKNPLFANTLSTSIPDNRIKVSNVNDFPYYCTAKLSTTFLSSPGYETVGSAYQVHKLCATAGHTLLNSDGEYFNKLKVQFGYNNGNAIYTMTQDDLESYVLHGEFKGTNWKPQIDFAFLKWKRDITNYVGYFGISWSYSPGDTCCSLGYPVDKEEGKCMYYSESTIISIKNCEIRSNNYSTWGQSGSPLFVDGKYAIGIDSGSYQDHSMVSVQLDNGITTWLHEHGYFD